MDSSSSCCVFNVEEEVVVIRNGWTPKKNLQQLTKQIIFRHLKHDYHSDVGSDNDDDDDNGGAIL